MSNPLYQESFQVLQCRHGSVSVCYAYTKDYAWETYVIHIDVSNVTGNLEENTRATLRKLLEKIDEQGGIRPSRDSEVA